MAIIKCSECGNPASTTAKACPSCGAKKFKPTNKLHLALAAAMVVALIAGFSGNLAPTTEPQAATAIATHAAPAQAPAKTPCDGNADLLTNYNNQLKLGKFIEAANSLKPCATSTQNKDLLALVKNAESAHLSAVATDESIDATARLIALKQLAVIDPDKAARFDLLAAKLPSLVSQQADQVRRADAERRKQHGPAVGMTKEQAMMSSWGKPDRVNTTTHSFGTSEQWIYNIRRNGYLYFENNRLTTIQN